MDNNKVIIWLRKNGIHQAVFLGEFDRSVATRIKMNLDSTPQIKSRDFNYPGDNVSFKQTKVYNGEEWEINIKNDLSWLFSRCSCGNKHRNIKQCARNLLSLTCERATIKDKITPVLSR